MIVAGMDAAAHPRAELWWSALGAGAVVIVCVVILLTLLTAYVRDIETRLRLAGAETVETSAHLADSSLIPDAADLIKGLASQLESQAAVLSSLGGDRQ